ncbi:MAG TPA: hypothetical protein VKZ91_00055 [Woeseiaceae bacterium]|nr:hypothetical protein [Woeseiaceae bacterium]
MREFMVVLLATVSMAGCASTAQLSADTEATDFSLNPEAFRSGGIGFLTPISATGHEASRTALALAFASSLSDAREDLRIVSLAEVLSAVNSAGLSAAYKSMIEDYKATGIMEKERLRQVGEVSDARYLGLLELADFDQAVNKRFSVGGLRLLDTKLASIRVSWQIWDSDSGTIAWEGTDEIHYAYDTGRERPVSFGFVAGQAATNLIAQIPLDETAPEQTAAAVIAR